MYIEITPDNYRVQFRYQSTPDYDSEIIDFAKLKQDLVVTLADDVADKTFADIAFAIAHDVAVIVNDTERKVYARLSAYDDGSSYTFDALTADGRGVWTVTNEDEWSYELIPIGGGGGTADHRQLSNRDAANQHPISSITGLESALEGKQPSGDYATTQELDALAEIVEDKYEKPSVGIPKNDLSGSVQSSLDKADTALQEHQSLAAYRTASEQDTIDSGKQPLINDLATIRSNAAAGAALGSRVTAIEGKIPSQASDSNQLADKAFVNSSIATNTAYFRGTYDVVNDLHLTFDATEAQVAAALASVITEVTNNDYAFVVFVDTTTELPTRYDRYKYGTQDNSWQYEFTLNNSSFTANEWASIQSGITAASVLKLSALPTAAELEVLLAGKEDAVNKVTSLSSSSTDTQYPTAKCVYDIIGNIESLLAAL